MKFFVTTVIIIVLIGLFVRCVKIVPQSQEWIVEFLGKYKATWKPGLHIKIPVLESVVSRVSVKERALDFPPQGVITKDNVAMRIDSVVFMKVMDTKLFTYGVENPIIAVENLASTTLRNVVGTLSFDETLSSRDQINTNIQSILDEATDPWGIRIIRVEVKSIEPPEDIRDAMAKQMKAEREKRQTVLEADAHKQAVTMRAEGDKQAKILAAEADKAAEIARAEGNAKSISLIYEAEAAGLERLKSVGITSEVLSLKGIEALKDIADGNSTKIFMPTDITKLIAGGGVMSEAMGIGNSMGVDPKISVPQQVSDICCDDSEKSSVTREMISKTE